MQHNKTNVEETPTQTDSADSKGNKPASSTAELKMFIDPTLADKTRPNANQLQQFYKLAALSTANETLEEATLAIQRDKEDSGTYNQSLITQLKAINQLSDRIQISQRLINLFKSIFLKALEDHGLEPGAIGLELCIAGSLAKQFATPFSDIDCFVILKNDIDPAIKLQLKSVFNTITGIGYLLFNQTHQFCMDPNSLTLNLYGTVEELLDRFDNIDGKELGSVSNSILGAKVIFSDTNALEPLLDGLQEQLKEEKGKSLKTSWDKHHFYRIFNEFHGPVIQDNKNNLLSDEKIATINIKNDLIRPLDCILQGFREQTQLSLHECVDHHHLVETLFDKKFISKDAKDLLLELLNKTYELRLNQHKNAHSEQDEVKCDPNIKTMLLQIGQLRASIAVHYNKTKVTIFELQKKCLSGKNRNQFDLPKMPHAKSAPHLRLPEPSSWFRRKTW